MASNSIGSESGGLVERTISVAMATGLLYVGVKSNATRLPNDQHLWVWRVDCTRVEWKVVGSSKERYL